MSGGQFRLNVSQSGLKNASICLTLACAFAANGCINTSTTIIKSHYNNNFIEPACSVRIGGILVPFFLCKVMYRAKGKVHELAKKKELVCFLVFKQTSSGSIPYSYGPLS